MNAFKQFLTEITSISEDEINDALGQFTERSLKKGDYFAEQGNICRHIGFILQGSLRTYYINEKGEETTACFCTENSLTTSYKSFILQQPSTMILQAIEDTKILAIDHNGLQKLYAQNPIWQTIGRVLAEREYLVMEKYASVLNNETAKKKYIRLMQEQPGILLKAKVEDIASYLGVSRRTLSRIRKELNGSN